MGVRIGCACVLASVAAIFYTNNYFQKQKKFHAITEKAQEHINALALNPFDINTFIRNANNIRINEENIILVESLPASKYKLTIYSQDLIDALQSLEESLSFSAAIFQQSLK